MASADAWIHAIQRRQRLVAPHLRRKPGEFPPGWQSWLDEAARPPGEVHGPPAPAIVDELARREPLPPPRRSEGLGRWQAFVSLWQEPAAPDERGMRWLAGGVSAAWHLFLGLALLWLMYLDWIGPAHPPPKGEEVVIQVEYVGDGTPGEVGGGPASEPQPQPVPAAETSQAETATTTPPPAPAAEPAPSSVPIPPVARVRPETIEMPVVQAPSPQVQEREVPLQEPAPAEQAVAVSEPVTAPDVFVLPPPTVVNRPTIAVPELQARAPTMEIVDVPVVPEVEAARLPAPVFEQPALQAQAPDVAEREVALPVRAPPVPEMQVPRIDVPALPATTPQVREREIALSPAPEPSPEAPAASTAAEPAADSEARETATAREDPTQSQPGDQAATADTADPPGSDPADTPATASAGPRETPAPGGWPAPTRADDWGASDREQPGAQRGEPPGLYDSDGSVRLAETPGSAAPGQPPGTITEEIADLDRAGTWLKRPPTDYEPTAFDQYWRPSESLLEEWVRRSVRTIRIPIPGTNKHIVCQTVLLALGGGCGIEDPNLNNQPATARPAPDVPFKPELQEGNGSVPAEG